MTAHRPDHLLVAGYYGFGNAGDELLLQTLVDHLHRTRPSTRITVATDDPVGHRERLGVDTLHLRDISGLLRAAAGARAVVVGGGGLFHDYWGFDPEAVLTDEHSGLGFTSTWPLLATITRTPLVLLGVGVGPLHSELGRRWTRAAFEQAALATVRDETSRAVLHGTGVRRDSVAVTADPALLVDVPDVEAQQLALGRADTPPGEGALVVVVLRAWDVGVDPAHWQRQVARALDELADDGARVLLLPFQRHEGDLTDDLAVGERVLALMERSDRAAVARAELDLTDRVAVVAAADLVIGMRLHSLVVAAAAGRPFVGLAYDPKVTGLCEALGTSSVVDLRDVDAAGLLALARSATPAEPGRVEVLRDRARADLHRLVLLLDDPTATGSLETSLTPAVQEVLIGTAGALAGRLHRTAAAAAAQRTSDEARVADAQLDLQSAREAAQQARDVASASAEAAERSSRTALDAQDRLRAVAARNLQLEDAAAEVGRALEVLRVERAGLEDSLHGVEAAAARDRALLHEIQSSHGWRVVTDLWRVRTAVAPAGGLRDDALRRLLRRPPAPPRALAAPAVAAVPPQASLSAAPPDPTAPAGAGVALPSPLRGGPPLWRRMALVALVGSRPVVRHLPEPVKARLRPTLQRVVTPPPTTWTSAGGGHGRPSRLPEERALRLAGTADRDLVAGAALPLVSVLLPVYDQADMLRASAMSVLEQSYPHLELVVIDDGSADDVEEVLLELAAHDGVRVLRQPNQKLPRALTHATTQARGQLLTWTSADNLMHPDAVSVLVGTLLAHPEAALAYADVRVIDDRGLPLLDRSYRGQNVDPERADVIRLPRSAEPLGVEADNYINACFLYRREASDALEGHYADDLRGLEDYDFWLRMQRCGDLRHAGNTAPLYAYRVHDNTMSHELLTSKAREHQHRASLLIQHEQARRARAQDPWRLRLADGLPTGTREQLLRLAPAAGARTLQQGADADAGDKVLEVAGPGAHGGLPRLEVTEEHLVVHWHSPHGTGPRSVRVPRGVEADPLTRKARDHRKDLWEFLQAGDRPVLVTHVSLGRGTVDVEGYRDLVAANPWAFFVLLDDPGLPCEQTGHRLVTGLENAVHLGARPRGTPYQTYACADAVLLPPLETASEQEYEQALVLSLASGRPLLLTGVPDVAAVPYQRAYDASEGSLARALLPVLGTAPDRDVLDAHLTARSPLGALRTALRLADAATQESAAPRPDFGLQAPPTVPPAAFPAPRVASSGRLRVCLAVDRLDAGGLEQVVHHLALQLPAHGIDVSVLCGTAGGRVAAALTSAGVRVHVAAGDRRSAAEHLRRESPDVVHSHYAGLPLLECATQAGVPVLETVHNTYVWLDEAAWALERERSRHFSAATAVSALARDYYLTHHGSMLADRVSVLPNSADPRRTVGPTRTAARAALGLADEVLLLALGRYDGQKNQLGLLSAFDRLAAQTPAARLLVAGTMSDPGYHAEVVAAHTRMPARDRVRLDGPRDDTALLYAAADAVVLNSFFEGWSLTATEAVLAGVPIVHSDCGGARELVGSEGLRGRVVGNPGGDPLTLDPERLSAAVRTVPQANEDALVDALRSVCDERDAWSARAATIRSSARRAFPPGGPAAAFARCYRGLVAAPGAALPV